MSDAWPQGPAQPGWPPPAGPGYAPPGYAPPGYAPLGYAPPGYGAFPAYGAGYLPVPTTSGKSSTVMILGIVGLVTLFTCGLGIFLAIAALVMAPGARRQIAASGGQLGGAGQIKAGVILAWITVGLTVTFLSVVVASAVWSSDSAPGTGGSGTCCTSGTSGVSHA